MPVYQVSAWNALFAPKEIVAQLNSALSETLDDPNTKKHLLDLGDVIPRGTERAPTYLTEFVKKEVARWTPVLKAAGATAK